VDKLFVLARHPNARVWFNSDTGKFKVYHFVNDCQIALSESCESDPAAWTNAADAIRVKDAARKGTNP